MVERHVEFVHDAVRANRAGDKAHAKRRRIGGDEEVFGEAAELVRPNTASESWGVGNARWFLRGQTLEGSGGAATEEFIW